MARVQLPGTSLSVEADLYDRFEQIRAGEQHDLSPEKFREMLELCKSYQQRREFSYYAVECLGVTAVDVRELVPDLTLADLRHIVTCRNRRQQQLNEKSRPRFSVPH